MNNNKIEYNKIENTKIWNVGNKIYSISMF
jgi:hypothetical protein